MPWAERARMSLRQELVHLVESQKISMTALCRPFPISRKTGYKWVRRFRTEGAAGLADRSRRPHQVPVRKVQQKGEVHFRGHVVAVSRAFRGYPVGLTPTKEDGVYEVRFCHYKIMMIDVRQPH